jgi:1,4-dihydroxy-2-naphthoyl-CoA hydrolase
MRDRRKLKPGHTRAFDCGAACPGFNASMAFTYRRTIRFADTDAAGVVFFPNYFAICHEAYEESLAAAGIELQSFFGENAVVVPISKSQAEYLRPLTCGDKISVTLTPALLGPDSYTISYELRRLGPPEKLAAHVRTEHVCISSCSRERHELPAAIAAWINSHSE